MSMLALVKGAKSDPTKESNAVAVFKVLEGPHEGHTVTLITKTYAVGGTFLQSIEICCCRCGACWKNSMNGPIEQDLLRIEEGPRTMKALVRDALALAPVVGEEDDATVDEERDSVHAELAGEIRLT